MGRYLVVETTQNNSKSISYLMASIIKDVAGNENFNGNWHLSQESIAKCIIGARSLLQSEDKLKAYMKKHEDNYWTTSSSTEEIKLHLHYIIGCLAENLSHSILSNSPYIVVWWDD